MQSGRQESLVIADSFTHILRHRSWSYQNRLVLSSTIHTQYSYELMKNLFPNIKKLDSTFKAAMKIIYRKYHILYKKPGILKVTWAFLNGTEIPEQKSYIHRYQAVTAKREACEVDKWIGLDPLNEPDKWWNFTNYTKSLPTVNGQLSWFQTKYDRILESEKNLLKAPEKYIKIYGLLGTVNCVEFWKSVILLRTEEIKAMIDTMYFITAQSPHLPVLISFYKLEHAQIFFNSIHNYWVSELHLKLKFLTKDQFDQAIDIVTSPNSTHTSTPLPKSVRSSILYRKKQISPNSPLFLSSEIAYNNSSTSLSDSD